MNGAIFLESVRQVLGPEPLCGAGVILDNLASRKVKGVRENVEATGASLLYLPPYSPDLNAIEQAFAKLKALLRNAAARTVAALWNALTACLLEFSQTDCSNFLKNAGYSI